jgi:hypothetical protein
MSEDDDDFQYCPPLRSTGSRGFPARSKASARGFLLANLAAETLWRQIIYESNLERQTLLLLLARLDLWNLWDQPPKVSYVDAQGRGAHHVFDYLVEFRGGAKHAIAVKPDARAERIGFRHTLACIRAQLPHSFADEVILVTEKSLHPAEVRNAELLHMFRKQPDAEADRIVAQILETGPAERRVADVVSQSGLGGRGFRAVIRAIYGGQVQADRRKRISGTTVLWRGEVRP